MPCISFAVQVGGIMVAMIGLVAIVGYIVHINELNTWPPRSTPIALPTAAAFVVTGLCLFGLGGRKQHEL